MNTHTCPIEGCQVELPPRLLMCRRHWYMVPSDLRSAVWRSYRPGQDATTASDAWREAAAAAIAAVERRIASGNWNDERK